MSTKVFCNVHSNLDGSLNLKIPKNTKRMLNTEQVPVEMLVALYSLNPFILQAHVRGTIIITRTSEITISNYVFDYLII